MANDKEFYDLWEEADKPVDEGQALALDAARLKAKSYALDRKIYIVRGYEMFVVHADDIKVSANGDGTRNVTVSKGKMVKYTEDGKRLTD